MGYMFCVNESEAVKLEAMAQKEAAGILRELPAYINAPAGAIGICVQRVRHPSSVWAIEADLTWYGETVRHYEAFDLLVLDLTMLEIKAMLHSGHKGEATA